jgi:hypothetical protein
MYRKVLEILKVRPDEAVITLFSGKEVGESSKVTLFLFLPHQNRFRRGGGVDGLGNGKKV